MVPEANRDAIRDGADASRWIAVVSSGTSSSPADPVTPVDTGRTARRQFAHPVGKNRYVRRSKISESSFRNFLRCFTLDMEATKIARLTHLNRNTVNRLMKGVRERIAETCEREVRTAGGGATRLSGHATAGIGRLHRAGELAHRMVGAQVMPDGRVHTWIVPAPAASVPQQQWPLIPSAAGPVPAPQASTGDRPPVRQRAGLYGLTIPPVLLSQLDDKAQLYGALRSALDLGKGWGENRL